MKVSDEVRCFLFVASWVVLLGVLGGLVITYTFEHPWVAGTLGLFVLMDVLSSLFGHKEQMIDHRERV